MNSTFDALCEPTRRQILDLLCDGPRTVNELVRRLRCSQPSASKHLRILRDANLVDARPEGRQRVYYLRPEPLAEVDAWLAPYRDRYTM